jgi:hypothetical protein
MIMPTTKMTKVAKFMILASMAMLPHVNAASENRGRVFKWTERNLPCNVYYERQHGQECALHTVNCVLHSAGKNIVAPDDMNRADDKPKGEHTKQHFRGWSNDAIESVLNSNGLSFDGAFDVKPNATAWILNDMDQHYRGTHWHAYVKNADTGMWFNVESYQPCGAGKTPGCQGTRHRVVNQCTECHEPWKGSKKYLPIRVGDGSDGAMMQRLQDERKLRTITLYRVEHRAQQPKFGGFGGASKPAPKPKSQAEGQWKCPNCETPNTSSKCTWCETAKPGPTPLAGMFSDADIQAAILASMGGNY